MDREIQLINDGAGVAVIGDPKAIELFMETEGLQSRELSPSRLKPVLAAGASATQIGSEVAANSGRWVKLTQESAEKLSKYSLMKGSRDGVSRAVLTENGRTKGFLEIVKSPSSQLANPSVLAGVGGVMAQMAMQQAMDEITDYLAEIDAKVDDILRAQKDAVLADMIGVGFVIAEALTLREHGGKVNEITWSKVQDTSGTIAKTQAYALRQLDGLAEKLEAKSTIAELDKNAAKAATQSQEWLAVLARCFQLQDAIAVLEIDRVLDASPEDVDGHRRGLIAARSERLALISQSTQVLLSRMETAAGRANDKVLTNPMQAPAIVKSSNQVTDQVVTFHGLLGIESARTSAEARRWSAAARETRDKAVESSARGFDAVKRRGGQTFTQARSAGGKVAEGVSDRIRKRRADDDA